MAADSFDGRTRELADGNRIPVLGLGVWQVPNGRECVNAVLWALEFGYRHIDTAQAYGNEASVGEALRRSHTSRAGVHHHQVPAVTPERRDWGRGQPETAWSRIRRPVPRPLARGRTNASVA